MNEGDDDDDLAFPCQFKDGSWSDGMTLRDYFAAKAMQGWLASLVDRPSAAVDEKSISDLAYRVANAMLARRKRR